MMFWSDHASHVKEANYDEDASNEARYTNSKRFEKEGQSLSKAEV
jgi:hypothetical protein